MSVPSLEVGGRQKGQQEEYRPAINQLSEKSESIIVFYYFCCKQNKSQGEVCETEEQSILGQGQQALEQMLRGNQMNPEFNHFQKTLKKPFHHQN